MCIRTKYYTNFKREKELIMLNLKQLYKEYKKEIEGIRNGPRFKLDKTTINTTISKEARGVYGLWHNNKLIYIGQSGMGKTQKLAQRVRQYTNKTDTGIKNMKEYLENNNIEYKELEFCYIEIEEKPLILIVETVLISYFQKAYPDSMVVNKKYLE